MNEQWQELKETIIEMRDNDGTGTQQEVCKFLVNYMGVLEKQMQEPKTGYWVEENINEWSRKVFCSKCGCPSPFEHISNGDVYSASGYGVSNKTKYCPNCGAKLVEPQESEDEDGRIKNIDTDI